MKQTSTFYEILFVNVAVVVVFGVLNGSSSLTALFVLQAFLTAGLVAGSVPVQVFCWHFVAGAIIEFSVYLRLAVLGKPPVGVFPLTFLYLQIWPAADFNIKNEMRSLAAGMITTGFLGGLLGLIYWYRFGGDKLWLRITSPIRNANQAVHSWWIALPEARRRMLKLSSWLFYGSIIGLVVAGGWWKWFGPAVALGAAATLFALIALIAVLDSRRSVPK